MSARRLIAALNDPVGKDRAAQDRDQMGSVATMGRVSSARQVMRFVRLVIVTALLLVAMSSSQYALAQAGNPEERIYPGPTNGPIFITTNNTPSNTNSTLFANAVQGGPAQTQVFTILNVGGGTLNIGTLTLTTNEGGVFSITQPANTALTAGQQTTFSVTAATTATGTLNATVNVPTNSVQNALSTPNFNLNLRITVNALPVVTLAFVPNAVPLNGASEMTVTIDNSGSTVDATSVAYNNFFPAGITGAITQTIVTPACAGGGAALTLNNVGRSNFTIPAGTVCTIRYGVVGTALGAHVNTLANVTSSLGNSAPANATLTVGPTGATLAQTHQVIGSFMGNRARQILSNQPRVIGFVDGSNVNGGGPLGNLAVDGNADGMTLAFSTSRSKVVAEMARHRIRQAFGPGDPQTGQEGQYEADRLPSDSTDTNPPSLLAYGGQVEDEASAASTSDYLPDNGAPVSRAGTWDVWTQIHGSVANSGSADNNAWIGYLGAHVFLSDHLLIGVLGQYDWTEEDDALPGSHAEGQGWMVGPYLAGQMPGQNLFFEARAAWGRSDNEVSPLGTYTDDFDTERFLVSGRLNGQFQHMDWTIRPEVLATWFEERQDAYTDSNGVAITSQTISLGELRFGPRVSRVIDLGGGASITPLFAISGVWNFGIKEGASTNNLTIGDEALRARFDAGLTATHATGIILALEAFYDGLGTSDYDAWGGMAKLVVPLN